MNRSRVDMGELPASFGGRDGLFPAQEDTIGTCAGCQSSSSCWSQSERADPPRPFRRSRTGRWRSRSTTGRRRSHRPSSRCCAVTTCTPRSACSATRRSATRSWPAASFVTAIRSATTAATTATWPRCRPSGPGTRWWPPSGRSGTRGASRRGSSDSRTDRRIARPGAWSAGTACAPSAGTSIPGTGRVPDRRPSPAASSAASGAGSVVLMHDGGGDRSATVASLDATIRSLERQGYRFVPA